MLTNKWVWIIIVTIGIYFYGERNGSAKAKLKCETAEKKRVEKILEEHQAQVSKLEKALSDARKKKEEQEKANKQYIAELEQLRRKPDVKKYLSTRMPKPLFDLLRKH